jgi:hypothetical protein
MNGGADDLALIFLGILIGIALTLSALAFIAQTSGQPGPGESHE